MSMQSLQAFREKVNATPALEAEVNSHLNGPGGALAADVVHANSVAEAIAAIAKANGFDFTKEELCNAFGGPPSPEVSDELSDFEMELVSAGNPVNCVDSTSRIPT